MLKLSKDRSNLIDLVDVLPAGQSKIGYASAKFLPKKEKCPIGCHLIQLEISTSSSEIKSKPFKANEFVRSAFWVQHDITCYGSGKKCHAMRNYFKLNGRGQRNNNNNFE